MVGFCCRHAAVLLMASGFVDHGAWPTSRRCQPPFVNRLAVSLNVNEERVRTRRTSRLWPSSRFAECIPRLWFHWVSVWTLATKATRVADSRRLGIIQMMLNSANNTKNAKTVNVEKEDLPQLLAQVEHQFVELWGDMSSWWGVSRTMAEIHGLLYITGEALSAEEIQKRLGISRGNVSMNIRTLVEWGLVRRVRKRGDRREYFQSVADVWEMFTVLAAQRKRREIDPVLRTLQQCREQLSPAMLGQAANDPKARQRLERIENLLAFLKLLEQLAERFITSQRGLQAAVQRLTEQ